MPPLASLSKGAEEDLGVPIERKPACLVDAQKPKRLIYGLMAISPYVIEFEAPPPRKKAFLDDPKPLQPVPRQARQRRFSHSACGRGVLRNLRCRSCLQQ